MKLDLTIYLTKEGKHYVAHSMPLDVVSSGSTPDAAREAVYEAVRAFLLTAAEAGTLEAVLEDCGYERRDDRCSVPTSSLSRSMSLPWPCSHAQADVEVPISIIRSNLRTAGLSRQEFFQLLDDL